LKNKVVSGWKEAGLGGEGRPPPPAGKGMTTRVQTTARTQQKQNAGVLRSAQNDRSWEKGKTKLKKNY
jgi:hypothetical protein